MRAALTFLFVMAVVPTMVSQQPSGNEPVFRSASSDLVVLPVTVTDRHGQYLSDIPQDHFAVFDNGRLQRVTLFTSQDTPVTIGLVVDNSGSMMPKTGEVIAGSVSFARLSNPDDELFVIEFNDRVRDAGSVVPFLMASDIADLQRAIESLRPRGQTALYDALAVALDRLDQGTRPRKALVVISDGGDNVSRTTLDRVLERARRSNVTVYTIGLFTDGDPDTNPGVLKALAEATGGERFLPKSAGLLIQACQRIARAIRSGYTIAYEPPDRDGIYHRVRVEVAPPDPRRPLVRTRPGYIAPRQEIN